MIPGDLISAFPHRQFPTLPGLLESWAVLPKSYPDALRAMQGGTLYHIYEGLWYDPAERRTHDLPCERQTRYPLSQPDTVYTVLSRRSCLTTKHNTPLHYNLLVLNYITKIMKSFVIIHTSLYITVGYVNKYNHKPINQHQHNAIESVESRFAISKIFHILQCFNMSFVLHDYKK